jgi:hypothetical protein
MMQMMLPRSAPTTSAFPAISPLLMVSDADLLLTYTSKQTEAQRQRVNASVAREHGIDTDGATAIDQL